MFWFEESKEVSVHKVDVAQMHRFIDVSLEYPKRGNLQLLVMRWKKFLQTKPRISLNKLQLNLRNRDYFLSVGMDLATVVHKRTIL